jgi:hypothetical protein
VIPDETDDIEKLIISLKIDRAQGIPFMSAIQSGYLSLERIVVKPYEVAVKVDGFCLQSIPVGRLDT